MGMFFQCSRFIPILAVVLISLLSIPVQCEASLMPHSLFQAPANDAEISKPAGHKHTYVRSSSPIAHSHDASSSIGDAGPSADLYSLTPLMNDVDAPYASVVPSLLQPSSAMVFRKRNEQLRPADLHGVEVEPALPPPQLIRR